MNPKLFKKRLIALYLSWKDRSLWANSDVIVISTPPDTLPAHPISSHFFTWLFGSQFPDTIAVFTPTAIHILAPKKKAPTFLTLNAPAVEALNVQFLVHRSDKCDDNSAWVDNIIHAIRNTSESHDAVVIGCVFGEFLKSKLIWSVSKQAKAGKYECVSVNKGVMEVSGYRGARIEMECLPAQFEEVLKEQVLVSDDNGDKEILKETCVFDDECDPDWVLV